MKNKKHVITKEDVEHVASLAKLSLKKGEIEKFKTQLSNIFGYIDQIGKMHTKGVSETSQTLGIQNRFREDVIDDKRMLSQKEALSKAKAKYKGFFVVKAILSS